MFWLMVVVHCSFHWHIVWTRVDVNEMLGNATPAFHPPNGKWGKMGNVAIAAKGKHAVEPL